MRWRYPQEHSFQLVIGQAYRVQECVPARVFSEILKQRIGAQADQARVALSAAALQPFESPILVGAIRVNLGDLVCRRIGKTFSQLSKRGIRFRDSFLAP